ncbi:MAG TPA: glycosyltransferase family 39 protein [Solirubrobacteraceae bacterium]|jgi:4-amino-4-deoxy-L-arabinose transferase-like glycosyltransferase|nr:glycosyltransferase family 39 protein [Solirubrobacteraceae bacterium]
MSTAEGDGRLRWGLAIGAVLLLALGLRIWGVDHGLPYAYNADENAHFVTRAIGIFGHDWNPNYYVNPPAYTYLVHLALGLVYGGRAGVSNAFATDPTNIWILSRVLAGATGTIAVWLLYLAGARLVDRRVGLLAAGIMAVSFLPVFYSKLALNDVPTTAGVCLALWGAAGILRLGRARDYVFAGIGLGLACATKYTGGIVLLAIVGAAGAQFAASGGKGFAARGLALVAGTALVSFFAANPYSVLDFSAFTEGLTHQSDASGDAAGKLGLTQSNGYVYYLWSFGWGLGWLPLVMAAGGAVRLWFDESRLVGILVPPVIVFVLFMGSQERYFGRWLLPVFPFVCILAAYAAIEIVDFAARNRSALRPTFIALAVVAVCGQGFVYSLHSGLVLSRDDTRNLARAWMVANVPAGKKVVIEPVVPDQWAQDIGNPLPIIPNGNRWNKYPLSRSQIDPKTGRLLPGEGVIVNIEDFERVLRPELVSLFEQQEYCWVVVGSTQRGRAEAEPSVVPNALAYYKELERRSTVAYDASPYSKGKGPVGFNFDWTFNYYPLAYNRPGPEMTIYRLNGGKCAAG